MAIIILRVSQNELACECGRLTQNFACLLRISAFDERIGEVVKSQIMLPLKIAIVGIKSRHRPTYGQHIFELARLGSQIAGSVV